LHYRTGTLRSVLDLKTSGRQPVLDFLTVDLLATVAT
jgi:hypothetical protein